MEIKATKKLIALATSGALTFDDSNWETNLNAVFVINSSVQDNIQLAIEFGYSRFIEHSKCCMVFNTLIKLATSKYGIGVRSGTIKDYICALTGTKLVSTKSGKIFKRNNKIDADPLVIEGKWYNFNNNGVAVAELDLEAMLKLTITRYMKGLSGDLSSEKKVILIKNEEKGAILMERINLLMVEIQEESIAH